MKLLLPFRAWRAFAHFVCGWTLFPLRYLISVTRPHVSRIGNHCYIWFRVPEYLDGGMNPAPLIVMDHNPSEDAKTTVRLCVRASTAPLRSPLGWGDQPSRARQQAVRGRFHAYSYRKAQAVRPCGVSRVPTRECVRHRDTRERFVCKRLVVRYAGPSAPPHRFIVFSSSRPQDFR